MENIMCFTKEDHTFAICAYKDSPYLEECIISLLNQTRKSDIILVTSTPSDFLDKLCKKYQIPLFINESKLGIAFDWNFAYQKAQTRIITIVHQDDIYEPDYLKYILEYANKNSDALIIYTNYYEIRNRERVDNNLLLRVKRLMSLPLSISVLGSSKFVRNLILSFGNPICCPSVSFISKNMRNQVFDTKYKNSCDYETWRILSQMHGGFVYCRKKLVGHRIHSESATSENICDNSRDMEDLEILSQFWPSPIAKQIFKLYKLGQNSNQL